jgi:uncharacterized membrane protein
MLVQAIPNLPAQALTLASWCASRVILYSSFYAIVGALFGMLTFGTIIGAISTVTVTSVLSTFEVRLLSCASTLLLPAGFTRTAC